MSAQAMPTSLNPLPSWNTEPDDTSLKAAEANGWTVVSMKEDGKTIFAFQAVSK